MTVCGTVAHRYDMTEPWNPQDPLRPVRATDSLEAGEVCLLFFPRGLSSRHPAVSRELRDRGERLRRNPHPLFLNVLDMGEEDDLLFLVEERPRGETLLSVIRDRRRSGKPFPTGEALGLCWLLCRAVDSMQRVAGHGFLNPQEIFLEPWEDGPLSWYPKVARPGIRACLRLSSAAFEGLEEEACLYAAPEFTGPEVVTGATDSYGIATLLYAMLTLTPPTGCFQRPSGIHPGFPAALEREILRGLEEDPRQRPSSPGTFSRTLIEQAAAGVPWMAVQAAERRLCQGTRASRPGPAAPVLRRDFTEGEQARQSVVGSRARRGLPALVLVLLSLILLGFGFRELYLARLHGANRLLEFRGWELRFFDASDGRIPYSTGLAGQGDGKEMREEAGR